MRLVSLLVLVAWPLLEIGLLIKAGQALGFWPVLGIVIGTAVLGGAVIANNGLAMAFKVQEAMARGEPPVVEMMDGAMVALAGFLLMTPGLAADAVGLVLLIPPVRRLVARRLLRLSLGLSEAGPAAGRASPRRPAPGAGERRGNGDGPIIEGEFERLDERTLDPARRKPPDRPA